MIKVGIIGGGACGLACANELIKQLGDNVYIEIIEKNPRIGKKIMMSGNGRCNLSNVNVSPKAYNHPEFVKPIISSISYSDLRRWFQNIGLMTFTDEEGRIYPISESSSTCLDLLMMHLEKRSNVRIITDTKVESFDYRYNKYNVKTDKMMGKYDVLVVATGSTAGERFRKNSMNEFLQEFGYKFTKLVPTLSALKVKENIKALKGVRAKCNVRMTLNDVAYDTKGEVMFKEDSLSGIAVFELSSYYARAKVLGNEISNCTLTLDLLPNYGYKELSSILKERVTSFIEYPLDQLIRGFFNKMINQKIYQQAGIKIGKRICGSMSDKEIDILVKTIKGLTFNVIGSSTETFQVLAGGLDVIQVNPKTLESKKTTNLYFGGEILDVDGLCGGYNLHFAFASGISIARAIISKAL